MDTSETDSEEVERQSQMSSLRRSLMPRSVALLHSLLHTTGQFAKSVALADLVASDQHAIYTAFSATPTSHRVSTTIAVDATVVDAAASTP